MKVETKQIVRISDQVELAAHQKHLPANRVRPDLVLVLGQRSYAFKGFMGPSTSNVSLKLSRNWTWMKDFLSGRGFHIVDKEPEPDALHARLPVVGDSVIAPIIPEGMEPWAEDLHHTAVSVIKAMPGVEYGCVNLHAEKSRIMVASLNMNYVRWAIHSSDANLFRVADRILDYELQANQVPNVA